MLRGPSSLRHNPAPLVNNRGFQIHSVLLVRHRFCAKHVRIEHTFVENAMKPLSTIAVGTLQRALTQMRKLPSSASSASIRNLHLTSRGVNALENAGIRTLGSLLDKSRHGLPKIRAIGKATECDIAAAIVTLGESTGRNGVDWIEYARRRGFSIIPAAGADIGLNHFARSLQPALLTAIESSFDSARLRIFRNSVLRQKRATTSTEVARQWGVTRQYITLMKHQMISALRESIFASDYTDCFFRFQKSFTAPLQRLKDRLDSTRGGAMLHGDWFELLSETLMISQAEEPQLRTLLFAVFRYEIIFSNSNRYRPVILPVGRSRSAFARAVTRLDGLSWRAGPSGISEKRAAEALNLRNDLGPRIQELPVLAGAIPGLEFDSRSRCYRNRTPPATRVTDQLEQILRKNKRAMHLRDILSELHTVSEARARKRTTAHISQSMSSDERFRPIGRRGLWALTLWDMETRNHRSRGSWKAINFS